MAEVMDKAEEARLQRGQLEIYLKWSREEGGVEGPTHLSTWFKPHQQFRLEWLRTNCFGKVMELGSNYGYVLAYCGGQIGVDHNENTVRLGQILSPDKQFIHADIRNLPFPAGYVDTVLLSDVLEHLPWKDVSKAINEAKRLASDRVLVTVPQGHTEDGRNFKHRWLMTKERQREVRNMFHPWHTSLFVDREWVLIRAGRR